MGSDLGPPLAFVSIDPDSGNERIVPILGRLFVGRECAGIDRSHRLVLDDPEISRTHVEIRLAPDQDSAYLVDTSTNGTRLNGVQIERAAPVSLHPGDRILVGDTEVEFRSGQFLGRGRHNARKTMRRVSTRQLAMVVGDIIGYSTISQYTDDAVLLRSVDQLFEAIRAVLAEYSGTLNNYVGDAVFAVWEAQGHPDASRQALRFAVAAARRVGELAPSLPLRDPESRPVHMGWGVTLGHAAVGSLTGMMVPVLGDATNVAFRIAELAGRAGRAEILATAGIVDATGDEFVFGEPLAVPIKGRTGKETVFGVRGAVAPS